MNVLIIEDDENKREQIKSFLKTIEKKFKIITKASYQSGCKAALEQAYNLIILDMTMPTFDINSNDDGGRPQPYGGRKIIEQMYRHKISTPVVILTQFNVFGQGRDKQSLAQLDKDLKKKYRKFYKGALFYSTTQDNWKQKIEELILKELK